MRMHITGLEEITSKKTATKWLKISGVSAETGEVVEAMLETDKVPNRDDIAKAVLSKEDLKEAFSSFEPVEFSFNKRGRLDSITT